MNNTDLKILACPGAKSFASQVVKYLKKKNPRSRLIEAEFPKFKNGETKTIVKEPIRGSDVFIIQDVANKSTGSINDNLMVLFTAIDTCMHASCDEINVIIPCFPYSRQHKKTQREGLTASLLCHFMESMGVKRVITLDIHSREIQNAFKTTIMENLHASFPIVKEMIKRKVPIDNLTVVAPDMGSISRNSFFASALRRPLAMMYKERDYSKINSVSNINLLGNGIEGKDILIADDMIDTGGTILKAAKLLKDKGAGDIHIIASLPFFNDPAITNFTEAVNNSHIKNVFGTDAVWNPDLWGKSWFKRVGVTELFADVIFRISEQVSLSELLDGEEEINSLLENADP